jgi:multidrug resistance efflux pump
LHNAELGAARQYNQITIEESRRVFELASANLANNTNMQIISAEAALVAAELNLAEAQRNYDDALNDHSAGNDAQILAAETALRDAGIALEASRIARDNARLLYNAGGISRNELRQAEDAFAAAENHYNDATIALENTGVSQRRSLEQLDALLQSAITLHQQAEIQLGSARVAAAQEVDMLRANVTTAEILANLEPREIAALLESGELAGSLEVMEIALDILERQLEDSTIRAPISGTVTAVIAREGAVGMGALFVIEDTDSLRIISRFREYDIAQIEMGMEVAITSDATGNAVYAGVISRINPAAAISVSVVEIEVEVTVTSQNTGLRIGTNTRINIILD